MYVLYRLLLAHFIADYPLQWSRFLRWKVASEWGKVTHSAIHVLVSIFFLLPYTGNLSFWFFMAILFATHLFQDWLKILAVHGEISDDVFTFLLDQLGHFCILALVLFFSFSHEVRTLPLLGEFYNNTVYIIALMGVIAATYAGSVLLYYLRRTFVDERSPFEQGWDGMAERLAIFLLIFAAGPYLWLIPIVVICRAIFYLWRVLQLRPGFDIILRGQRPVVHERWLEEKGDVAVDLIGSPLWAIIAALIAQALISSL